jgi:hypothetical protein
MYIGLSLMNEEELAEITRLIGVEQPPSSRDVLLDIVSGWIARAVKCEGKAQTEVERRVLEWTASSWKIIIPEGTDTNDLERSLRLKIAQDAADFLSPGWALCCALIAVGKGSNIRDKLDLMEQAAATAVPSQRARSAKRDEWNRMCDRWSKTDPGPELDVYVNRVAASPELHSECLTLGLALSLLDGSIGFPTERLYRDICDRLDMSRADSDEIKHKVNELYWKFHNEAVPTQTKHGQADDPIRSAAHRTVYGAGVLESLAAEAKSRLFASLEPDDQQRSGWSKLVGGLSGMSPFFSNKMKNSTHATLARVVYHTILKQHYSVVVAARLAHSGMADVLSDAPPPSRLPALPEDVRPSPRPAEPLVEVSLETPVVKAPEPVSGTSEVVALTEQMVDETKNPKRIIKLDF